MLHKATWLCMCFIASVTMWSADASADVIYDNGAPDYSDASGIMIADRDFYHEVVDDFVLQTGAAVITDVHWWGVYSSENGGGPLGADRFLVRIFTDVGGAPGATPLYEIAVADAYRTDTGNDLASPFADVDVYGYWADITPIALNAGTTYWLSITNDTTNDAAHHWWWMAHDTTGGNALHRSADGDSWITFLPYEAAFQLTNDGVVPEPASVVLLGLSVLVIGRRVLRNGGD